MKKLKYLFFVLPFLIIPNVFAKEVDVTSNCYGTTGYGSMYSGDEVQYQTYSNYNFGTTYQYQLSSFETELRYSLSANTDYVITFNTNNSNDFRNNFKTYNVYDLNNNSNNLVTGFTFVSMKKVQISFKTTTATNKVKIQMGGSNVYDNITGETNWNIKNAILTIPESAPSGSTTQDVIDNQTQNTNTIVNNNNQNTNNIINNNNQNTQDVINNQNNNTDKINDTINSGLNNKCSNLFNSDNVSICRFGNGNDTLEGCNTTITDKNSKEGYVQYSTTSNWNGFHTDYLPVNANLTYYLSFINNNYSNGANVCIKTNIYRSNKTFISQDQYCTSSNNVSRSISMPYNAAYVRISMEASIPVSWNTYAKLSFNTSSNYCVYGSTTSKLDETNTAINDVNNSINNSNVDSGTGQGFFDNFTSQDFGLSQIITIPLTTIQSLTSKTCMPLVLPIPFTNETVSLPCMTEIYQDKLPSIYNLWKIVSFGIVSYFIAIDIFHIVKGFKDPESDKVEVLDL